MISEKMKPLVNNNSAIRAMFEEGKRLAAIHGAENVYDFSLGNPNVPAPAEVNLAICDILKEEESTFVHGYMSNAGYEDVRQAVAESLNKRFGTRFHQNNILMTVGAASGLNVILKTRQRSFVLLPSTKCRLFRCGERARAAMTRKLRSWSRTGV